MLDGMFTALVIGPAMVLPSDYLPEIWGTEDDGGPEWDSIEQALHFLNLLTKHWNAIAARREADAPHVPFIFPFGEAHPASFGPKALWQVSNWVRTVGIQYLRIDYPTSSTGSAEAHNSTTASSRRQAMARLRREGPGRRR